MSRFAWGIAAVVTMIGVVLVTRLYRAEALRADARTSIDRAVEGRDADAVAILERAEIDLRAAVALHPGNASAWSDLAFALEMQALLAPARAREFARLAEEAARRALAISTVVPEFWIRLGVALDTQRRFTEAGVAFQRCLELAPRNSPAWYYYAYHLSLDTKERAAAVRAVATSLSLDPGNSAAEALRAKLNAGP